MATLQYLSNQQINEVLQAAADRQIPVTITVQGRKGWMNLRSRIVAADNGHLCLELPEPEDGAECHEFQPADKAGVSFKLRHHKHIFTATVAGTGDFAPSDGQVRQVLRVCSPTKMQRMQRRAFLRADVPPNRIVRASFWLGGRDAEPSGTSPERPVWSGRISNISAGGFQAVCEDHTVSSLEAGEIVGVRISFGAADETVYADAQFRHAVKEGQAYHVGFQFVGLGQTPDGRKALQLIGSKAGQFQRELTVPQRCRA